MIVHKPSGEDVSSNIPKEDTQKMGFANMEFVFDIVFKQMYRDPIGSLIREITSNCFDSHIEAEVNDPVIIEVGSDEGGNFIRFTDVGIGISPERMDKIYKNAGESTKRSSNKFIGYFGLGSKSPLAYTDNFFLDTISDGIKYEYVIFRSNSPIPDIQLIDTEETTKHNGSEIKVYIKAGDRGTFESRLRRQLRYFDNVFLKGVRDYDNNYKILQAKTFKFRKDHDEGLHLCIGKVIYPIDWQQLEQPEINLPFALKFDIGDLPVTPERESIKYTTIERADGTSVKTVDIIKAKIEDMKAELQEIVNRASVEHNNLSEYYEDCNRRASITLDGITIDLSKYCKRKKAIFTPLVEIGINTVSSYPFINWKVFRRSNRVGSMQSTENQENPEMFSFSSMTQCLYVRFDTIPSRLKKINIDYLFYKAQGKSIVFITKHRPKPREFREILDYTRKGGYNYDLSSSNMLDKYKAYRRIMTKELILNTIDYATLEIPQDYYDGWKLSNNNKGVLIAEDGEIIVENVREKVKSYRKKILPIEDIESYKGFILYGFSDDEDLLESFADLFSTGTYSSKDTCSILKIKQKDSKHFVTHRNCLNIKAFMSPNPIFKKVATAAVINNSHIWDYGFFDPTMKNLDHRERLVTSEMTWILFLPLEKKMKTLHKQAKETVTLNKSVTKTAELLEEIIAIAEEKQWIDDEVKTDLNLVDNYLNGLELINYIVPTTESIPHIVDYFKLTGKKINPEWTTLEQWQVELIKETNDKATYVLALEPELKGNRYMESSHPLYKAWVNTNNRKIVIEKEQNHYKKVIDQLTILTDYHDSKEAGNN